MRKRKKKIFLRLGYIDTQNFAGNIRVEVMFVACLADCNCPLETQFAVYAVYNKIESKKEMIVYPDFGHEPVIPWI